MVNFMGSSVIDVQFGERFLHVENPGVRYLGLLNGQDGQLPKPVNMHQSRVRDIGFANIQISQLGQSVQVRQT